MHVGYVGSHAALLRCTLLAVHRPPSAEPHRHFFRGDLVMRWSGLIFLCMPHHRPCRLVDFVCRPIA